MNTLFNKRYKKNTKLYAKLLDLIMLPPKKYLICDLKNEIPPVHVWLQGTIEQSVINNILILSDGTSKAKIVKCGSADGVIDKNCLCIGAYCCVIGTATKTNGLPEIEANKIVNLSSQPHMKSSWHNEVKEANYVLQEKLKASL